MALVSVKSYQCPSLTTWARTFWGEKMHSEKHYCSSSNGKQTSQASHWNQWKNFAVIDLSWAIMEASKHCYTNVRFEWHRLFRMTEWCLRLNAEDFLCLLKGTVCSQDQHESPDSLHMSNTCKTHELEAEWSAARNRNFVCVMLDFQTVSPSFVLIDLIFKVSQSVHSNQSYIWVQAAILVLLNYAKGSLVKDDNIILFPF